MAKIILDTDLGTEMERNWEAIPNAKPNPLVRMLALPLERFASAFAELSENRNWSTTTQASKLASLYAMAVALGCPPLLLAGLAKMKTQRLRVRTPAWSPSDVYQIARPEALASTSGAALLAYLTGHRLGDILRLRKCNVYRVLSPAIGESLALMVVCGKTVSSTGPYPIHPPASSKAAAIVREHLAGDSAYLFLDSATVLDARAEDKAVQTTRGAIQRQIGLDTRALRRGGLSVLALLGNATSDLRTLSRHTSDDMTRTYLGAGLLDATLAKTQHRLVTQLENSLTDESASYSVSRLAGDM
jgi:integrase